MKSTLISAFIFALIPFNFHPFTKPVPVTKPLTGNVFIITIDGFRWQEIFSGADSILINMESATPDTSTLKAMYWDDSPEGRRKKLMPFFWNVISRKGCIYGNRNFDSRVDVMNPFQKSYPGYHEMFTGNIDRAIHSNDPVPDPDENILEFLNKQKTFEGKVAAFTSWDVFPFILNEKRSNLVINSGYDNQQDEKISAEQQMINRVQDEIVREKKSTRYDELTFLSAKEYILANQPRVLLLGLGETDEFAHEGRYDLYLQQANSVDQMIAALWHLVQTMPGYKDNTTFIITTDHGRGSRTGKWDSHGEWIRGSSNTWMAMIGPGISALGEIHGGEQMYQAQLAQTVAMLLGNYFPGEDAAPAISLR